MDKRPIGYVPGKGTVLDKKVPRNPKFQNVQSKLSTGTTVKDITVVSDKQVAKRKGELFKRIKNSTVANLIQQEKNFESIYQLGTDQDNQSQLNQDIYNIPDNQSIYSHQSNLTVQSEASKLTAITYQTEQLGINDDTTFLLLDLREPEDYQLYHIAESINFPAPRLSQDKLIPQLHRFKNKDEKLIIIYHFDERQGTPVAQLFAEKGFENVFLISEGIEEFMNKFPELIEGTKVPVLKKPQTGSSSVSPVKKSGIQKRSNYKEYNDKSNIKFDQDVKGDQQARSLIQSVQNSQIGSSVIGSENQHDNQSKMSIPSKVSKPNQK